MYGGIVYGKEGGKCKSSSLGEPQRPEIGTEIGYYDGSVYKIDDVKFEGASLGEPL